jgi:hypothetical protein
VLSELQHVVQQRAYIGLLKAWRAGSREIQEIRKQTIQPLTFCLNDVDAAFQLVVVGM